MPIKRSRRMEKQIAFVAFKLLAALRHRLSSHVQLHVSPKALLRTELAATRLTPMTQVPVRFRFVARQFGLRSELGSVGFVAELTNIFVDAWIFLEFC